ncbi:hypothetical protein H4R19_000152 [Coemansia spiralis]|nr:hypothetical protein H4R19_000152 [Coemansia spiralis]
MAHTAAAAAAGGPAPGTRDQLFGSATSYLEHLSRIVGRLGDAQYTQESRALPGSTIGKHVRHVLDHFALLLAALSSATAEPSQPLGPVCYSHRQRDPSVQSTVAGGQAGIARTVAAVEAARRRPLPDTAPITISDTLPGGAEASFLSTVDRELWFCIHHMVHHNAIVASLMYEFGMDPPTEFAYAPSTLKHAHSG